MYNENIVGIYLAAGHSSRMGTCKLSLPLAGDSLGTMALKEIVKSKLNHLVIVTKDFQPTWLRTIEPYLTNSIHWEHIISLQAHLGQSYSLRTGIQRAKQVGADAVIIFLADQPFITSQLINKLIDRKSNEYDFIASFDGVSIKPPILFQKKGFDSLLKINGDQGARSFLKTGMLKGLKININDNQLIDIDTLEQYETYKQIVSPQLCLIKESTRF
ncbi:nucleotidyltransferase family protein [Metabacillus endolithicus]|uniref:NTP transferase domain-containing protein n=1 Tax=Metabacillus endolithicus TaxID=1535204 RepID=A0ABW5C070_9BACI|nr:nucleotidyltransferase family protein [Metabacillus endolithicus]UPG64108.1 nucleotidyltransferase family protein [Metabacillus endolithicus]